MAATKAATHGLLRPPEWDSALPTPSALCVKGMRRKTPSQEVTRTQVMAESRRRRFRPPRL
jgi:hypothetical protein